MVVDWVKRHPIHTTLGEIHTWGNMPKHTVKKARNGGFEIKPWK